MDVTERHNCGVTQPGGSVAGSQQRRAEQSIQQESRRRQGSQHSGLTSWG